MTTEARSITDHYTLGKELGSGGFSTVRIATKKDSNTTVAVKTLDKTNKKGDNNVGLIRNEILVMAYILEQLDRHPHLIQLLDVFDEPKRVHIVMEVCSGGELFEHIVERGHYSEEHAASIIRQVASGLEALHKVGVLHRDMKPENLLFEEAGDQGTIKLMDFGLSYIKGSKDAMRGLCGSLDYFAPESLSRHMFCEASDLWALGVILYILLVGYPPFYGESSREKQQVILAGKYDFDDPMWKSISDEAKHLIQNLLNVDPTKRLTATQVLEHPWVKEGGAARKEDLPSEVRERISKFNGKRKFRAAAYACMAGNGIMYSIRKRSVRSAVGDLAPLQLSNSDFDSIYSKFHKISKDGRSISYGHFESVMNSCSQSEGKQIPNLQRVFELFDTDGNGQVDLRELLTGIAQLHIDPLSTTIDEQALKFCFKVYDADDNGTLSLDEIGNFVHLMAPDGATDLMKAEALGDLFEAMDVDKDGSVSFQEFKQTIECKPHLISSILDPIQALSNMLQANRRSSIDDAPGTSDSVEAGVSI